MTFEGNMKRQIPLLLPLLAALVAGCSKSADIVGTWVSPEDKNGGYTYMIFEEDDTYTFGSYFPPTDKYGGSESRSVSTYSLDGNDLAFSDSSFYEYRSYNLDGSLRGHRTNPFKGGTTRIEWKEDDIIVVWEDDTGFPYKKFDELPREPSF